MPSDEECDKMHRRITDVEGSISALSEEQRALIHSTERAISSINDLNETVKITFEKVQPLLDAHTTFKGVKSAAAWLAAVIISTTLIYQVFFEGKL